jgi:hypothetical protein
MMLWASVIAVVLLVLAGQPRGAGMIVDGWIVRASGLA